jgi:hypothetical protein
MSWDLWLEVNAGGEQPATIDGYEDNITWNLQPMLSKALQVDGFRTLDGRLAIDVSVYVNRAIEDMTKHPKEYKKLNPPNGWGSYEVALTALTNLLKVCNKYPGAILRIV